MDREKTKLARERESDRSSMSRENSLPALSEREISRTRLRHRSSLVINRCSRSIATQPPFPEMNTPLLHRHRRRYKAPSILHLSILLSQHFSGRSFRQSDLDDASPRASAIPRCIIATASLHPSSLSLSLFLCTPIGPRHANDHERARARSLRVNTDNPPIHGASIIPDIHDCEYAKRNL